MAQSNGWKGTVIGVLSALLISGASVVFVVGAGKASKEDFDEHEKQPAHQEQRVLNERIGNRLENLEKGQDELKQSMKDLPKAVAEEIKNSRPDR